MLATFFTFAKPFLVLAWLAAGVGFFAACYTIKDEKKE